MFCRSHLSVSISSTWSHWFQVTEGWMIIKLDRICSELLTNIFFKLFAGFCSGCTCSGENSYFLRLVWIHSGSIVIGYLAHSATGFKSLNSVTFSVSGVIFSLFTRSGRKSKRESSTSSFTVWNSSSPFSSAQKIKSRSFHPRPLSSCRT